MTETIVASIERPARELRKALRHSFWTGFILGVGLGLSIALWAVL